MKKPEHSIAKRQAFGFTLIELLTVIAIIGVLAGLLVGLAPVASRKMKESRIQAELAQLILGIENFRTDLGYYPPDHPYASGGVTNYAVNQLFYELTGTVVANPQAVSTARYTTANGLSTLSSAAILSVFGTPGFVNVAEDPKSVKNFLRTVRESQVKQVTVANQAVLLLVVPVELPRGVSASPQLPPQINPWRYNSSTPVHNPGRFDLWAEVRIGTKTNVFGNWRD